MARKKAPADLAELDVAIAAQETGRLIPILNMDGVSPLGFSVRVAGPDSKIADAARQKMQDEVIARDSVEPLSTNELNEQLVMYLARITIAIEPQAKLDGRMLENTEADFAKLYRRFKFIRQQVNQQAGDRGAFLPDSAPESDSQSND